MSAARFSALALALAVAGCGGGGAATPPPSQPAAAVPSGTATLTLSIPRRKSATARRAPRYVSPNFTSLGFYDGGTLVYAGNFVPEGNPEFTTVYASSGPTTFTPGTCTFTATIVCTATVKANVGSHTLGIVMYPNDQTSANTSTPPVFTGVILSEGDLVTTIAQGTNPGVTMTLLGAAAGMTWGGPSSTGVGGTATITYQVNDAGPSQIIQPGAYDNGPVTITASPPGTVTMNPSTVSNATPPAANGDQSFTAHCNSGGLVTFTARANNGPTTVWPFGLTYSPANYPAATLGTTTLNCIND